MTKRTCNPSRPEHRRADSELSMCIFSFCSSNGDHILRGKAILGDSWDFWVTICWANILRCHLTHVHIHIRRSKSLFCWMIIISGHIYIIVFPHLCKYYAKYIFLRFFFLHISFWGPSTLLLQLTSIPFPSLILSYYLLNNTAVNSLIMPAGARVHLGMVLLVYRVWKWSILLHCVSMFS